MIVLSIILETIDKIVWPLRSVYPHPNLEVLQNWTYCILIIHFLFNSQPNHIFEQIKQEYKRNSRIGRLMNPAKSYSIEQYYINLSIVETKEQREKEKQLQGTQHAAAVIGIYEEIYTVKTPVDVKDIFKTCKKSEKQVLVLDELVSENQHSVNTLLISGPHVLIGHSMNYLLLFRYVV